MGEKLKIITPEYVELEYEVAGIGSRLMAWLIDTLIQAGVLLGLYLVALLATAGSLQFSSFFASLTMAATTIVSFLVIWAYYIFFEVRDNGQTPGKKKMKLRVIRETGHPIDLQSSFIRNIVRIADYAFALGFFVMFLSKNSRRLGDWAARTAVVKERITDDFGVVSTFRPRSQLRTYKETHRLLDDAALSKISRISKQDYERIAHFLQRVSQVDTYVSYDVAKQLALPIMQTLEMDDLGTHAQFEYEAFLSEVARAYERYMGQ